jgi:hypothetical protein
MAKLHNVLRPPQVSKVNVKQYFTKEIVKEWTKHALVVAQPLTASR